MNLFNNSSNPSFLNRGGNIFDQQTNGMNNQMNQYNSNTGGNNLFNQNQGSYGMNNQNSVNQNQNNQGSWLNNTSSLGINNQNRGINNQISNNLFNQQNSSNSVLQSNGNSNLNMRGIQNNSTMNMNLFGNSANNSGINTRGTGNNRKLGTTVKRFEITSHIKEKPWKVHVINYQQEYSNKSLDELRAEDYQNMKSGNLPDNYKILVAQKIQEMRASGIAMNVPAGITQNIGSGSLSMNSNNQNMFLGGGGNSIGGNSLGNNSMGGNSLFNSNSNNGVLGSNGMNSGSNAFLNSGGNNMGGNNIMGNSLFSGNNQNMLGQGMNNGGNQNLFANSGNNMGNMGNSGSNNLFNRQNSGNNVSLFNSNAQGNNLFNQGSNSNNLFAGNNNQSNSTLFSNNQQGQSLYQNNQGNLFNQQNQSQNLFSNNQGNQIMTRSGQPNMQLRSNNMQGGFNSMGGGMQPNQQLFPQNNLQAGNSLFQGQGGFIMGNQAQPQQGYHIAYQTMPGAQFMQYPYQGYATPYMYGPGGQSSMSYPQTTSNAANKSFSLFSLSKQGGAFSLSGENPSNEADKLHKIRDKTLDDYLRNPFDNHSYFKDRTNVFLRSAGDFIRRSNYRAERSADSTLERSDLPTNVFGDKRRDISLKTRGRVNSANTLEMIFSKHDENIFGVNNDRDYSGNGYETTRRHKGLQLINDNAAKRSRVRSSSPVLFGGLNAKKDRYKNDVLKINVVTNSADLSQKRISIRINKTEKIGFLKALILKELEFESFDTRMKTAVLYFNSQKLTEDSLIEDAGIQNEDAVTLSIEDKIIESTKRVDCIEKSNGLYTLKTPTQEFDISLKQKPADPRLLPNLTKSGYSMVPSLETLSTYSELDLKRVEGFVVKNQNGKIEFEGCTDVTAANLDILVEINPKFAEVYPERYFPTEEDKPKVGTKLNKPAKITLYNCYFDMKKKTEAEIQEIVKKKAERIGAEFISYDKKEGTFCIRVTHF